MICFVKHQDIDPAKWDDAVLSSRFSSRLATFELLNALTADAGWDALIEDDYAAVMPLPRRVKWGVPYIYTPFFISGLGIFSPKTVDADKTSTFFHSIPCKFRQVDLILNTENDPSLLDTDLLQCVSHRLNLQQPYPTLFQSFSQNTKRNIKTAQRHSLSLTENPDILEQTIELFKAYRGKSKAVNFRKRDYETLHRAAMSLHKAGALDLRGALTPTGELAAGALFLKEPGRTLFWFSGRNGSLSVSCPMFFIINEYIKENAGKNIMLDFNGSSDENVARLYRSFGGMPYQIPMIHYSAPWAGQWLVKLYRKLKG